MDLNYNAPPTIGRFMRSESFGRIIAGPVGSGKTTGAIIELLRRACEQHPGSDGLKHTQFAVVRQTLKQLKDTVVKDCQNWLAQMGEWRVSENRYYVNFDNVRSELVFLPLETAEDQGRLLSMQLTGAWLSEAIEMDIGIIAPLSGRCGRYPSGNHGTPTWQGIIADTNFPTEMTPWHTFMENPPPEWQIFKQPSGLSDEAENLAWLIQTDETMKLPPDHPKRIARGRVYYERLLNMYGLDSPWVKRYVKAEYGPDPSGMAVFAESFQANFHLKDTTTLIPGYPIIIGQDFGRTPWSLITQPDHLGRIVCHEEVAAENIGLEKHVTQVLRPRLLQADYMGFKVALVGDPAGVAKDNHTEETSFELLQRCGFPAFPAPTNDIDPRLRAVESYLGRQINGGPAIIINRRKCPILAQALGGGYRFAKMKSGQLKAQPDKNPFSHVADCLQYVALVCHGGSVAEIARRLRPRTKRAGPRITSKAWT